MSPETWARPKYPATSGSLTPPTSPAHPREQRLDVVPDLVGQADRARPRTLGRAAGAGQRRHRASKLTHGRGGQDNRLGEPGDAGQRLPRHKAVVGSGVVDGAGARIRQPPTLVVGHAEAAPPQVDNEPEEDELPSGLDEPLVGVDREPQQGQDLPQTRGLLPDPLFGADEQNVVNVP